MDTRFLESLMTVARLGSIVGAARVQGLTPAAISQRIQVLEQEIGAPLLLRRANTASPTQLCLDLLPMMEQMVDLRAGLRQAADPGTAAGILRLGAISTMLSGLVPRLLPALRGIAPQIEVRIEPGSSAALYEALREGRLDAALIVAPPDGPSPDITLQPLHEEPLCLLAPQGASHLPLADLFRQMPLIAYDPRSWGGRLAERYLQDRDIHPARFCTLDGLEAISSLVASGIGASIVPRWLGLQGGAPLPDAAAYARRIVLASPARPAQPANQAALMQSLKES